MSQKQSRPPAYNLVLMLRMKISHTHTPGDYEKIYFSHNNAIWGEQGRVSGSSKNGLRKQDGQMPLELIILGGGAGVWVLKLGFAWFGLSTNSKGGSTSSSLSACLGVEQKRRGGVNAQKLSAVKR